MLDDSLFAVIVEHESAIINTTDFLQTSSSESIFKTTLDFIKFVEKVIQRYSLSYTITAPDATYLPYSDRYDRLIQSSLLLCLRFLLSLPVEQFSHDNWKHLTIV